MTIEVDNYVEILKADAAAKILYGFAIVCKHVEGDKVVDYHDLHGDNIPEEEMVKAATDFMARYERTSKAQHGKDADGRKIGDVMFCFPLTQSIAKGLGIQTQQFGLLIGIRPHDEQVLKDAENGVYKGFSFGGLAMRESA